MCHLFFFFLRNIFIFFIDILNKNTFISYFCTIFFVENLFFYSMYTRSYCFFFSYLQENICLYLQHILLTLHLFTSPTPAESTLSLFLNALQHIAHKFRSILHFWVHWSIDSRKKYYWQLWPKLKLVKYHPAAPETGGQRTRAEKQTEREISYFYTRLSILFSHFFAGGLPRFRETIIRMQYL